MRKIDLVYPFVESANLEVEYQPKKWARVTPNHFRCFTGRRRVDGDLYYGPVFYERTNIEYIRKPKDVRRIVGIQELNNKKQREKAQLKILDVVKIQNL